MCLCVCILCFTFSPIMPCNWVNFRLKQNKNINCFLLQLYVICSKQNSLFVSVFSFWQEKCTYSKIYYTLQSVYAFLKQSYFRVWEENILEFWNFHYYQLVVEFEDWNWGTLKTKFVWMFRICHKPNLWCRNATTFFSHWWINSMCVFLWWQISL